jgi:hypothetical protein
MGCMCMECKYATVVTDNHGKYHRICVRAESLDFLRSVSTAWGECDDGEIETDESEGAYDV